MALNTVFEKQVCSRCRGTGSYSYCTDYGSRCFKCAGAGEVLTKRGSMARAKLEELCTIPAHAVRIGDRVLAHGVTNNGKAFSYIATVIGIQSRKAVRTVVKTARPDGSLDVSGRIEYSGAFGSSWSTVEHSGEAGTTVEEYDEVTLTVTGKYGETKITQDKVRVYPADNSAKIAEALEYQASLTKAGKPRKV